MSLKTPDDWAPQKVGLGPRNGGLQRSTGGGGGGGGDGDGMYESFRNLEDAMALAMEESLKSATKEKQLTLEDSFSELSLAMEKAKNASLLEIQNGNASWESDDAMAKAIRISLKESVNSDARRSDSGLIESFRSLEGAMQFARQESLGSDWPDSGGGGRGGARDEKTSLAESFSQLDDALALAIKKSLGDANNDKDDKGAGDVDYEYLERLEEESSLEDSEEEDEIIRRLCNRPPQSKATNDGGDVAANRRGSWAETTTATLERSTSEMIQAKQATRRASSDWGQGHRDSLRIEFVDEPAPDLSRIARRHADQRLREFRASINEGEATGSLSSNNSNNKGRRGNGTNGADNNNAAAAAAEGGEETEEQRIARRRAERRSRGAGAERRISTSMTVNRTAAVASDESRTMSASVNSGSAIAEDGRRMRSEGNVRMERSGARRNLDAVTATARRTSSSASSSSSRTGRTSSSLNGSASSGGGEREDRAPTERRDVPSAMDRVGAMQTMRALERKKKKGTSGSGSSSSATRRMSCSLNSGTASSKGGERVTRTKADRRMSASLNGAKRETEEQKEERRRLRKEERRKNARKGKVVRRSSSTTSTSDDNVDIAMSLDRASMDKKDVPSAMDEVGAMRSLRELEEKKKKKGRKLGKKMPFGMF